MKQCDFPVRITMLHMRPLHHEHYSTKVCNDADSHPTLRAGVRGIYLAAPLDAQARSQVQTGLLGLAAASVPKPTVAQYTRHFRCLQVAGFAKESGPYGEAPRHEVMVMLDNFPEKSGLRGERRVRKSLKRQNLSSASFP